MSAAEVGSAIVALCREGKNLEAIDAHYSADVTSVEAAEMPGLPRSLRGIEAVRGKNQWWLDNHVVHSNEVLGPFPHGDDRFAIIFRYEVTPKAIGQRVQIEEVGVYTLADGKVSREEFYYSMG